MKKKEIVKLSIPNSINYLSIARLSAASIAAENGYDVEEIDDIKLSVWEACNSIMINSNNNINENITIKFNIYDEKIKIKIKSTKKETVNKIIIDEMVDITKAFEDGLNKMIIESLMDKVIIDKKDGKITEIKMLKFKKEQ